MPRGKSRGRGAGNSASQRSAGSHPYATRNAASSAPSTTGGTTATTNSTAATVGNRAAPTQVSDLGLEQLLEMVRHVVREERANAAPHSPVSLISTGTSTSTTAAISGPLPSSVVSSTSTPTVVQHVTSSASGLPLGSMPIPALISSIPLATPSSSGTVQWTNGAATSQDSGVPHLVPRTLPALGSSITDWILPATSGGMSLSISTRPISARILHQIQAGRYIEMRDLLGDNAAVRQHFEELHGALGVNILPMASRPRVREVSTLPSWICCFLTYLAVGTTDPVTRDRLTYAVLLTREAMRHGGQGWLDYDRLFRQQAAINPSLPWNTIHPGLHSTTILGQRSSGTGTYCLLCQECDHVMAQCALAQLQPSILRGGSNNPVQNQIHPPPQAGRSQTRICNSWNDGACTFPGSCTYRHVCSVCFRPSHPAKECRQRPRATGQVAASSRPAAATPRQPVTQPN